MAGHKSLRCALSPYLEFMQDFNCNANWSMHGFIHREQRSKGVGQSPTKRSTTRIIVLRRAVVVDIDMVAVVKLRKYDNREAREATRSNAAQTELYKKQQAKIRSDKRKADKLRDEKLQMKLADPLATGMVMMVRGSEHSSSSSSSLPTTNQPVSENGIGGIGGIGLVEQYLVSADHAAQKTAAATAASAPSGRGSFCYRGKILYEHKDELKALATVNGDESTLFWDKPTKLWKTSSLKALQRLLLSNKFTPVLATPVSVAAEPAATDNNLASSSSSLSSSSSSSVRTEYRFKALRGVHLSDLVFLVNDRLERLLAQEAAAAAAAAEAEAAATSSGSVMVLNAEEQQRLRIKRESEMLMVPATAKEKRLCRTLGISDRALEHASTLSSLGPRSGMSSEGRVLRMLDAELYGAWSCKKNVQAAKRRFIQNLERAAAASLSPTH
jgi:hypothetical protein